MVCIEVYPVNPTCNTQITRTAEGWFIILQLDIKSVGKKSRERILPRINRNIVFIDVTRKYKLGNNVYPNLYQFLGPESVFFNQ